MKSPVVFYNHFHFTFATQLFYLRPLFFLLLFLFPVFLFAQLPQDSGAVAIRQNDSTTAVKDSALLKNDSAAGKDSVATSAIKPRAAYEASIEKALQQCKFLKASAIPSARVSRPMPPLFNDILFYLLVALVLFFAFLRFLYQRYFNNMFRVFFNTSLRQGQLTDQLLQSKQVSLFYNALFILTGGFYIYFLLAHFKWIGHTTPVMAIGICTLSLAFIYFIKYSSLVFTGWITGYSAAANTYLFIIFLINKILGVLLIPFVIVIAFGREFLQYPAVLVSLLLIGLMFLLRFLRSYGLLRKDIKVSRFHFFIYILGVEVLPLLLIYKSLMVLFGKNG